MEDGAPKLRGSLGPEPRYEGVDAMFMRTSAAAPCAEFETEFVGEGCVDLLAELIPLVSELGSGLPLLLVFCCMYASYCES